MYILDGMLFFGIVALLIVSILLVGNKRGKSPAVGIYFFLAWTFFQYFLSPIVSNLSGGWEGFLLFPHKVDQAICVAMLFVLSVALGYAAGRASERRNSILSNPLDSVRESRIFNGSYRRIAVIASLSFLLLCIHHLLVYGGLQNLFYSELSRGAGQFSEKGFEAIVAASFYTGSGGAGAAAAVMMGAHIGRKPRLGVFDFFLIVATVVACSFPFFSGFSRASGVIALLMGIAILIPGGSKAGHKLFVIILFFLGIYLCAVGITQRAAPQGIASFIAHAINPDMDLVAAYIGEGPEANLGYANANPFDAIASISAYLSFSEHREIGDILFSIKDLFFAMQPLPAALLGQPVRFGPDLATAMGTVGTLGLTTPALAELYHLFGWLFIFLSFGYGWFMRRADVMLYEGRRMTRFIVLMLVLGGIVVAGHNGLRAFARPTVLAIILMLLSGKTYSLGRFRISL